MTEPRWLSVEEVIRLHEIQIHRYGGQTGIRDQGLLESAVLRPRNRHHYDRAEDLIELAAGYAEGISGNHPFFDGNKRTAFFAMAVFLELNGLSLRAPESEATNAMLRLAEDAAFAAIPRMGAALGFINNGPAICGFQGRFSFLMLPSGCMSFISNVFRSEFLNTELR